ncbi:hypothetical protein [Sphingobium yanoikuyae]|jgi:hypothetical protein|uniref:hypothetical protein n=1 Tax=Sphingobium yanoikuyae TaxID=13690 RepID=UPI000C928629|nr:hypothetical protein [Rhizobiaceae bacterium]|tara:strand:- start:2054 stop:3910 length:1857 start_codon:yes stop_codon:yes gene_type:complete
MLQIREIRLTGPNVEDASVKFGPGPNVIAGESDTGKSYLLHCLDYIFGAEELKKRIPQAEPYDELKVEFQNTAGDYLTLVRSLSGGDLKAHRSQIDAIDGNGETIAYRRHGTSKADDVTSVLFPFAGIKEALLRKDNDGKTQRLTIRTFLPTIIVDEVSVIEEQSPVLGRGGFDDTARKRMFAYMLSGKDDSSVVASEKKAIVTARLNAQVALIDDLLAPLEEQLQATPTDQTEDSIEKIDETIAKVSDELAAIETERANLLNERDASSEMKTKAETQVLAIDQLLTRYQLLSEHYTSDLNRLDFVAEGAHYFDGLQTVTCPLCGQNMNEEHVHKAAQASADVYAAARAEAAKILAQRADLEDAIGSLEQRREARDAERATALATYQGAERRLASILQPAAANSTAQLRRLNARRLELESARNTSDQVETLRALKAEIEKSNTGKGKAKQQWESLPGTSLLAFCKEIEAVLKEWKWEGEGRVEFDEKNFDIKVDGQTRQSHGKGFRAVLYSAFVIALVRYCQKKNLPHPGVLVIDSPLTSYKRRGAKDVKGSDSTVSFGVETAFWEALTKIARDVQVIIVENKEPPASVAAAVHYEWFAGNEAEPGDRVGFIPEAPGN